MVTGAELARLLEIYRALWPGGTLPSTGVELAVWQTMLGGASREEAAKALYKLARSGERFAPPIGLIAKTVEETRYVERKMAEIFGGHDGAG